MVVGGGGTVVLGGEEVGSGKETVVVGEVVVGGIAEGIDTGDGWAKTGDGGLIVDIDGIAWDSGINRGTFVATITVAVVRRNAR